MCPLHKPWPECHSMRELANNRGVEANGLLLVLPKSKFSPEHIEKFIPVWVDLGSKVEHRKCRFLVMNGNT